MLGNSVGGNFVANEGGRGILRATPKLFQGGGRSARRAVRAPKALRERAWADVQAGGRRLTGRLLAFFCAVLPHFCSCLSAVASMTERLMVLGVDEQCPVATVGLDVVHICRADSQTPARALTAEGFTQKLRRPKVVRPDRKAVPPVPCCSLCTSP